jgi:hypothetical protein
MGRDSTSVKEIIAATSPHRKIRSVRDNRLIPVEQPSDQLGSLPQVLLLDGIHPDISEVGFNAIEHPRQRHVKWKKRMIEIGRVQFGS